MDRRRERLRRLSGGAAIVSVCLGAALLLSFAALTTWNGLRASAALQEFERVRQSGSAEPQGADSGKRPLSLGAPDKSLWSQGRIRAYRSALADFAMPVEGVLAIESVNVRVPVFEGTSDAVLAVGAGRIKGTAPLGADGNVGIAAHRDGHFRGLKDIEVGDEVVLETARRSFRYEVFATSIVGPEDVHVLEPTAEPQLTLVTCYPFYFVGHAPRRFIVHARAKSNGT